MRQPAMAGIEYGATKDGYPVSDDVMRGGLLLACHHGLTAAQIAYMHETFEDFCRTCIRTLAPVPA
jgi:CDP-4-dehydro-6-deoxyglucose reductase, E1